RSVVFNDELAVQFSTALESRPRHAAKLIGAGANARPRGTLAAPGEVSERSKERDWKSRMGRKVRRGFKSRPLRCRARVTGPFLLRNGDLLVHPLLLVAGDGAIEVVAAALELHADAAAAAGGDVLGRLRPAGPLDRQVVWDLALVLDLERVRTGREGRLRELDLVLDLAHRDLLARGGRLALGGLAEDLDRREHPEEEHHRHCEEQRQAATRDLGPTPRKEHRDEPREAAESVPP